MSKMGLRNEDLWEMGDVKRPETLTKENFIRHLNDTDFIEKGTINTDAREFQIAILKAFDSLLNISRDLQDLTFCTKFNSVSNAVGPTIADTEEDKEKVERFLSRMKKNVFYIPSNRAVENPGKFTDPAAVITNDAILNAFFSNTLGENGASKRIFENFFLHYSQGFMNVRDYFKANYLKGKLDSKLYNKLLDDYMYYCLTFNNEDGSIKAVLPHDNKVYDDTEDEVGDLDYLVKGIVGRFKDIIKLQEKRSIPNMLLDQHLGNNCLRVREKDEYITQDVLEFNSSQVNVESQDDIRRAWDEVLQMNDPNLTEEENEKIRRFGVDLFFYSLMRNGFGFSPKTLMHLATTIVRYSAQFGERYAPYIDGIRNIFDISTVLTGNYLVGLGPERGHLSRFCDMFVRNHSNNKSLVPYIEGDSGLIDENMTKGDVLVISAQKNEDYKLKPFMLDDKKPLRFVNLVTRTADGMHYDLYELDGSVSAVKEGTEFKSIRYKKTTKLGISKQFIEYNANEDVKQSYYESIRGTSDAGFEEEDSSEGIEKERPQEDDVYEKDEENEWDLVYEEIQKVHGGKLVGTGEFGGKFRQKLREVFESKDRNNPLAKHFEVLLNKEASEASKKEAWEEIKSLKDQLDDIIKAQDPC